MDFDYTETQLESFLQSAKERGEIGDMRESGKVRTSTLISSFLRSLNRFSSRKSIKVKELEVIDSEDSPEGKSPSPAKKRRPARAPAAEVDSDDDLERDPVSPSIDLKKDMATIQREVPAFRIKPMEADPGVSLSIAKVDENERLLNQKHGRPLRPNESLMESQYEMPKDTQVRDYLLETMKIFDENYNYDSGEVMGEYPPHFWGNPVEDELFEFCHYILIVSKMETEIPILALAYVERLLLKTGLLLNFANWRKLVLTAMILASKIWDDDSFEN